MLITVLDLEREPVVFENLAFDPAPGKGAIDYGSEVAQVSPLIVSGRADLIEEHRGPRSIVADICLQADWSGDFEIACARCLAPVRSPLQGHINLIFRPLGVDAGPSERAIGAAEAEIGYYQESSLLLEDVLREQVLLSLPARTLCREDCKGLCPGCGRDLNTEACACDPASADPRWSALSDLASRMKK